MKIRVTFDNYTADTYDSLEKAKEAILEAHANGTGVDRIVEVYDDGEELLHAKEYGCSWDVTLEPLN